jgi:hypothetical protein
MNRNNGCGQTMPLGESLNQSRLSAPRQLRRPIVHGLLRDGETMSLVAPYDTGKSWMAIDLAFAIATGEAWLGSIPCETGRVLFIDSELHPETFTRRMLDVAVAKQIDLDRINDRIDFLTLRCSPLGDLRIGSYLDSIDSKSHDVIMIDSFEPFMLSQSLDSDSSAASLSTTLYRLARKLRCALVLVRHIGFGDAPEKPNLEVTRLANNRSFGTDTVVAIRPHCTDKAFLLQAKARTWPTPRPRCFRWHYPLWQPDESLDLTHHNAEDRPKTTNSPGPEKGDARQATRARGPKLGPVCDQAKKCDKDVV